VTGTVSQNREKKELRVKKEYRDKDKKRRNETKKGKARESEAITPLPPKDRRI